jgi:hypothetical protein
MAIPYQTPIDDFSIAAGDYQDIAIGGKLVRLRQTFSEFDVAKMTNDVHFKQEMKHRLAYELASYMLEQNLVEFTSYQDPPTMQTIVAVRAYLAPSDQIKLLRIHTK